MDGGTDFIIFFSSLSAKALWLRGRALMVRTHGNSTEELTQANHHTSAFTLQDFNTKDLELSNKLSKAKRSFLSNNENVVIKKGFKDLQGRVIPGFHSWALEV